MLDTGAASAENPLVIVNCIINILSVDVIVTVANTSELQKYRKLS